MSNWSDVENEIHKLREMAKKDSNLVFTSLYKDGIFKVACFDTSDTTKFTFEGGHGSVAKRVY